MAREQRRDVDYFPHDCTHGRKMHIIENKYGNDGYATWFKLLEQLGKANNHYIHIADDSVLMYLASVCKIEEEVLKNILNDLSKLGAIDKVLYDEYNVIWSQKFVDSVSDAYRKRKTETPQYSAVLSAFNGKNEPIRAGNPSNRAGMPEVIPKEEYSRVKESKEEKRKENSADKSAPKKARIQIEISHWQNLVDEWFKFYKTKFIVDPTFNAVQGKHLKFIAVRFEKMAKEKDAHDKIDFEWPEDRAVRTLKKFLENAWADKWLQEHFLLKNLEQNFDAIINKTPAKNGTTAKNRNR